MKPILLRVEWVDATLLENRWQDAADLEAGEGNITTVGFRVKSEDGYLFLAGSWNPAESHLQWASVMAIPERAIVKKKRLTAP